MANEINWIRVDGVDYRIGGCSCEDGGGSGGGSTPIPSPGGYEKTEFRFNISKQVNIPPDLNRSARTPEGWTLAQQPAGTGEFAWIISAIIDSNNKLSGPDKLWSKPIRMTGEPGGQGASGVAGIDYERRYCIGTKDKYDAVWNDKVKKTRNPSQYGWSTVLPKIPDGKIAWFIQARILHKEWNDEGTLEDEWSAPNKYAGTGGDANPGRNGQIVYPAGVYDERTTYTSDEFKTPYVYVPDKGFYILRASKWTGTSTGLTPAEQFDIDHGVIWVKVTDLQAIYADVGILGTALIGSAVFNKNYMFSQTGLTSGNADSSHYENFNPNSPYDPSSQFRPNFCIDYFTGEMWAGAGNIHFDKNGAGQLAKGEISWEKDGNVKIKGSIEAEGGKIGALDIDKLGLDATSGDGSRIQLKPGVLSLSKGNNDVSIRDGGIVISGEYGLSLDNGNIKGLSLEPTFSSNQQFSLYGIGVIINNSDYQQRNYLPTKEKVGRIVFVMNVGNGSIVLGGNIRDAAGKEKTEHVVSKGRNRFYIFDGSRWNEFYCGT